MKVDIESVRETLPHRADEFMERAQVIEARLATARAKNYLYMEFARSMLKRFNTFIELGARPEE